MEEEPVIVRENWKETIKRRKKEEKRLRYEREESESERRGRLMESFVEPTCSDWIVDTEAASDKALEIRSNINAAIDAIDTDTSQEIQRDFSALIELLKSSKRELNDELLYVLDTFLHEESKWEESACFKWTARCRSGIHYLSHLVALVVLGVDGYRQNNSEEASNNLTIVATVIIVASLVLGKWNDRMYKSLLDKRIRRGELERIQRYVEVTIKRCDALIPFYENLQELRQQERALTSPEVANAIEKVNDLPHKYRGPAARCVKTVIKEHPIPTEEHSDEETPLGSRIRKLQEEERAIKAKQQVEFDIVAEESKKSVGGRKVNALSPIGIYEGKEAKKEDRKRSTVFLDSDTESQDDLDAWRFNVERQQSIEKRERKESDLSHASKNLRASAELARHISEV
jgi:hypothetical protein